MEPPPQPTPSHRLTFTIPTPTSRTSRSRVTATPATPATPATLVMPVTPAGYRRGRIRWISKIEKVMLEGLVKAVNKGYRVDSSYKANS